MINTIKAAGVFVNDSAKAYDFYVNKLGFEVRADFSMPNGYRWLEVAPKDSQTVISVSPADNGQKVGGFANIILTTLDMVATHADLTAKGVEFTVQPKQEDWGDTLAMFIDPDGNIFMLSQENTAKPAWETPETDQTHA